MLRHTFKKSERLTNKKTFDQLFKSGKSISVFPFRWVWIETNTASGGSSSKQASLPTAAANLPDRQAGCQLGISVPKKSFQKAVHRNTLKRRIREAYRKNKHLLYEVLHRRCGNPQNKNHSIALMIIYTAQEQLPYSEIEKKMVVSLVRITNELRISE